MEADRACRQLDIPFPNDDSLPVMVRGPRDTGRSWRVYAAASLALPALAVVVALWTRLWVVTAFPIGFLFGFSLHKGDLCTAAACSEVVLFREARRALGLWICVVVSMLGFTLLDRLGWIVLGPMSAYWANNIVGGALFGSGMTLAGGCVSGCLFKSAAGNVNSMAGLVGVPLGALMVRSGPLMPVRDSLARFVLAPRDGGPLTFSSVTGLAHWQLSLLFALGTALLLVVVARRRRKRRPTRDPNGLVRRILTRPWKHWQAGLIIGLLAPAAYVSSAACGRDYPLGVASGVIQTEMLLVERDLFHVYKTENWLQSAVAADAVASGRIVEWWEVVLVFSLFGGAWVSGRLSGDRLLPKPPAQTVIAFFGGILMGIGVGIGFGCNIGHILSGWALMSVGSLIFGVSMILGSWLTTYLYLR